MSTRWHSFHEAGEKGRNGFADLYAVEVGGDGGTDAVGRYISRLKISVISITSEPRFT